MRVSHFSLIGAKHYGREGSERAWYRPVRLCRVRDSRLASYPKRVSAMGRYREFNPKRRLAAADNPPVDERNSLAKKVTYTGNPEHKRNPGDFGLTPPAQPRRGKTLCDGASIFKRSDALHDLREGLRRGAVSEQSIAGWPKIVWAVTKDGTPLEAHGDGDGRYHGYPMPPEDPMATEIKKFWDAE